MNAQTLALAMPGLSLRVAKQLVGPCNEAMIRGGVTTRNRAVSFLREIGHESVSLLYRAEIGGPGLRYAPYYGRGFIMCTWRKNYWDCGMWIGGRKLAARFVANPDLLLRDDYAWLSAVWYWTTRDLNALADQGRFDAVSYRVNGGWNGIADRRRRGAICLRLGDAILPTRPSELRFLTAWERKQVKLYVYHHRAAQRTTGRKRAEHLGWERWHRAQIAATVVVLTRLGKRDWSKNNRGTRRLLLARLLDGWSLKDLEAKGGKP